MILITTFIFIIVINIFIIINITSDTVVTFPVIAVIKFSLSRLSRMKPNKNKNSRIFIEMTNNNPYANNKPNNHDLNNSAPKTFVGRNNPSSFSPIPSPSSCKLEIIEQNDIWGSSC